MYLSNLANIAEIFAALAILFSIIKVWPAFYNLDQLVKRDKDWRPQLRAIQSGLTEYNGEPCADLPDVEAAMNEILAASISSGSSDISIEIKATDDVVQGCISFRRDGHVNVVCLYDADLHLDLVIAFKKFGHFPEEQVSGVARGRGRYDRGRRPIDFRCILLPSILGEYICLRILDPNSAILPYSALGIGQSDLEKIKARVASPQGLMIFGGPTGSGKTVSFYTSLRGLDDQTLNIFSIEDPVEIDIPGIVQLGVQDRVGHRFTDLSIGVSTADPDIVLIGEIRGEETAHYAFKMATTGHFVMSCLHSDSVIDSLLRLNAYSKDGLFPDITLMNQKLARRLCTACSEPANLSTEDIDMIEMIMSFNQKQDHELSHKGFKSEVGCDKCSNGYRGRVGGYEVLEVGEQLLDALAQNAELDELWSIARDSGTETVGYNLLMKAAEGGTSLEEVRRVTAQS